MAAFDSKVTQEVGLVVGRRRDSIVLDNTIIPSYNDIAMKHVTTNIRFPEDQYKRLKHLAVEKRRSLSGLVRDAVAKAYAGEVEKATEPFDITKDSIWKFVGSINDPKDRYGSEQHDDIYEENEFTSDAALRIQRESRRRRRKGASR